MSKINGKRILLVGGAGFIGHHLAVTLKQRGAEVGIVDSLQVNNLISFMSQGPSENTESELYLHILHERLACIRNAGIRMWIQDARDYHALCAIFSEFKPDVVIQLAAVAHANRSNKDPYSTFDHSLRTLENALDAARGRVEHFIYFSSSMVYGNFKNGFVTEESPCEPLGIYGALKYAGEKLVISYNQVFDLPYTIVRPSALYGERCVSRRVGQIFIENAMRGLQVAVNGDGSDALDFTYINDLVHGICCVIESERSRGEVFNLTYGESRTMRQMAEILAAHFSTVDIKYLPKDKLMPDRGTLCVDKARELIGYNPSFPLEQGFVRYINWYKQLLQSKSATTQTPMRRATEVIILDDTPQRTQKGAKRKKPAAASTDTDGMVVS
jgi:nucleoside-diphosphate-sugar epimerase